MSTFTNAEKALGALTGASESLVAAVEDDTLSMVDDLRLIAWAQAAALTGIGYAMLARLEWEQKMADDEDAAFG